MGRHQTLLEWISCDYTWPPQNECVAWIMCRDGSDTPVSKVALAAGWVYKIVVPPNGGWNQPVWFCPRHQHKQWIRGLTDDEDSR